MPVLRTAAPRNSLRLPSSGPAEPFRYYAREDGCRALVVTPLSVSAPYWNKLLRASVIPGEHGFLRFSRQQQALADSDRSGDLALFAVDFAPSAGRRCADPAVSPCEAFGAHRGRPLLGSALDQADRALIQQRLSDLRVSLREDDPSSDPP